MASGWCVLTFWSIPTAVSSGILWSVMMISTSCCAMTCTASAALWARRTWYWRSSRGYAEMETSGSISTARTQGLRGGLDVLIGRLLLLAPEGQDDAEAGPLAGGA